MDWVVRVVLCLDVDFEVMIVEGVSDGERVVAVIGFGRSLGCSVFV